MLAKQMHKTFIGKRTGREIKIPYRKVPTTVLKIQDKWNASKVWVIKRYACGHYYWNQEIRGSLFYTDFRKTTKAHIIAVLGCPNLIGPTITLT